MSTREDPVARLCDAAAMPIEGHDAEWLRFMDETLKMPGCYLPAAQEILRQNRWRRFIGNGNNPIGYVKTATYQEAMKMGLALDKYNVNEPRVITKDAPARKPRAGKDPSCPAGVRRALRAAGLRSEVGVWWRGSRLILMEDGAENAYAYEGKSPMDAVWALLEASKKQGEASGLFDVPDDLRFKRRDTRVGLVALPVSPNEEMEACIDRHCQADEGGLTRTESGAWHSGGGGFDRDDEGRSIPAWLQRDGEPGAVDWHVVAQHVVRKPKMVLTVTKALELRAAGISRPRAVATAKSKQEARKIEAAWKWIDREWDTRVVPLLRRERPPEATGESDGARSAETARTQKGFIEPGEVLARISGRGSPKLDAPSIQKGDRLRVLTESIGLRPEVRIGWNGNSLSLSIGTPDKNSKQKTFTIDGLDGFDEAVEMLREIAEDGEAPELFQMPSATYSEMSQNRPPDHI
jgi:hypothetical protein